MCKNLVIFIWFQIKNGYFFMFLHRFSNAEIKFLYSYLWFSCDYWAVLLINKANVPGGLEVWTSKPRFASGSKIPTSKPPGTFWQKTGQNVFTERKNSPKSTYFRLWKHRNSVKCFQNVFTEAIEIKKTANISGFEHFRNYSNSIVLFSKWSKMCPFCPLFTGAIP